MKGASFNDAILSFFSRYGQHFHPTKDQPRTRPASPFLYICCNFGQIFCTNVIQFFSVENMGNNQLKKCSKYHLVSLLNEKQRSTFANFWHLFIHVTLLTHSALSLSYFSVCECSWQFQLSLWHFMRCTFIRLHRLPECGTGEKAFGAREGKERGVLPGRRDGGVHLDHGQGAQGPAEGRDGGWGAGEAGFWAVPSPWSVCSV